MDAGPCGRSARQRRITASDLVRLLEHVRDDAAADLAAVERMVAAAERRLAFGAQAA